MSNIKDRVLQIAEHKGIGREKFFEELGLNYGNFKGKAKDSALSSDAIATILSKYPDLNPNWLISGEGNMMKLDFGLYSTSMRLKQVVLHIDKDIEEIASDLGFSNVKGFEDAISGWLIDPQLITDLCFRFGYNAEWVYHGNGEMVASVRNMKESPELARILQAIEKMNKSNVEISNDLGYPITLIDDALDNGVYSESFIEDFCNYYGLNIAWIRNGQSPITMPTVNKTEMLDFVRKSKIERILERVDSRKSGNDKENGKPLVSYERLGASRSAHIVKVPLVSIQEQRIFVKNCQSNEYLYSLQQYAFTSWYDVIPKKSFIAFVASGNDMNDASDNSIKDHDILIGEQAYTVEEGIFVIVHNDGIIVRKVEEAGEGKIKCSALNLNKTFFPDLTISKSEIKQFYLVKSIFRSNIGR